MKMTEKTKYIAKFNTKTITRTSRKFYTSASAYVNQQTGEIKNVTFSAKPKSNPQKAGIFNNVTSQVGYRNRKSYLRAIEENKKLEEIWKIETVIL
jgi:hypothetical protein